MYVAGNTFLHWVFSIRFGTVNCFIQWSVTLFGIDSVHLRKDSFNTRWGRVWQSNQGAQKIREDMSCHSEQCSELL